MRHFLIFVAATIVLGGVAAWMTHELRAKASYDRVRRELAALALTSRQMDDSDEAFFNEVRSKWFLRHSEVGGPHAQALVAAGYQPTVANLVELLAFRLPKYAMFSPTRQERSAAIGLVQAQIMPISVDRFIYVSEDRHRAMVKCEPNLVYLFSDEDNGIREAFFWKSRPGETSAELDGAAKADP